MSDRDSSGGLSKIYRDGIKIGLGSLALGGAVGLGLSRIPAPETREQKIERLANDPKAFIELQAQSDELEAQSDAYRALLEAAKELSEKAGTWEENLKAQEEAAAKKANAAKNQPEEETDKWGKSVRESEGAMLGMPR